MSELMDQFWQTPPLARTFAAAIFVTSLGVYTMSLPSQWLYFDHNLLFRIPPQIWRFVTTFLISQPNLGIILDPYFVYSYVSQLETGHPKFPRREDLVWYLTFVSVVILTIDAAILGFHFGFYLNGLILSLAYTATQDQRGIKANFFFVTIPAQLIPYAMIFVSFIMGGPFATILQFTGLFAAHLYDFLTRTWPEFGGGYNFIPTPGFFSRLVSTPRVENRAFGTIFRANGNTASSGSSSATGRDSSGPLPDAWRTRGRGQRLGGD